MLFYQFQTDDPNSISTNHTGEISGFTLVELLVSISIIFFLLALLFPGIQAVRESARKIDCSNRIRNITIASQNFESSHGHFPSAVFADEPNRPKYGQDRGALLLILPFLENHSTLTDFVDGLPATSVQNADVLTKCPSIFRCPSSEFQGVLNDIAERFNGDAAIGLKSVTCDYAGNSGFVSGWDSSFKLQRGSICTVVKGGNTPVTAGMIFGGLSNTFLFWESNGSWFRRADAKGRGEFDEEAVNGFLLFIDRSSSGSYRSFGKASSKSYLYSWTGIRAGLASAYDRYGVSGDPETNSNRFNRVINVASDRLQPMSPHSGGCFFSLADGSVIFVSESVGSKVFYDLVTRD